MKAEVAQAAGSGWRTDDVYVARASRPCFVLPNPDDLLFGSAHHGQDARATTDASASSFIVHPSSFPRSAFTLIEMLTTVAVLIIVLGLMVSLARYVRDRSAQQLTRQTLQQLDVLMGRYVERNGGTIPAIDPILPPEAPSTAPASMPALQSVPDESVLAAAARRNSAQYVAALKLDYLRHRSRQAASRTLISDGGAGHLELDPLDQAQLPISVYDHLTVRDAWGSPIVFMPGQHRLIGMAPSRAGQDQYFFFSAGPDRHYLSREDNLYSYEAAAMPR